MAKSKKEKSLAEEIKSMIEDSQNAVANWEQNNQKWHKMRMRIKKKKSFPFIGCSNMRMPTIETNLRKLKAALVNVVFGIRPVVQVVPNPNTPWQSAIKIEKFLDHLIMDIIKLKPTAIIAIDQTIEKGFYLLKPYWKIDILPRVENIDIKDFSIQELMVVFNPQIPKEQLTMLIAQRFDVDMGDRVRKENQAELEKVISAISKGKSKIDATFQDVLSDRPDVALCKPENTYVAVDAGYHPQSCEWICHEFELPLETVKLNAETKGWDLGEIKDIEDKAAADVSRDIDGTKRTREGIEKLKKNNKVAIQEWYGWYDINGDGENEKCVVTLAPDFDKVLRKISLPFTSGKYPFVKTFYELTDDRWFAHRGLPDLIEDIVKEIDIQHMQKIDQQTMRNVPMYVHRAGMINKNTIQFIFGQSIPVQGMQNLNDIIAPLNNNNPAVEFSYEREQMILETKVQELIGQVDFSLQSLINKRQPRTLGEVQLQNQNMQQVFSLDAELARISFEELFNWIWELWCQYGSDEYEFAYFGKQGWEQIRLTREEMQSKVKITVRGNDQNTNPQVRLQKAQMILEATKNPLALQAGIIQPPHIAEAYQRFYQELDIPNPERLSASAEQMMEQMKQQQPPPDDIKLKGDDLTDKEKAQVLKKRGIQPDAEGRYLKEQKDREQIEFERIETIVEQINKGEKGGEKRAS